MRPMTHPLVFAGEQLLLTNQRVVYWERERTLLLADLHLGKAAHFRKSGIAIPRQVAEVDLQQLEQLLAYYQPKRVIIVGDLVHAGRNAEVGLFGELTRAFANIQFTLVRGNHDRVAEHSLFDIGIQEVFTTLQIGQVLLTHEHQITGVSKNISGHLHPGMTLKLTSKQVIKLPCFVVADKHLILPAFSRFTGLDTNNIPASSICYGFHQNGFVIKHN